ncbi:protein kinase-like protein [Isoptericola sp. CG 20/1183]|uniref:Protein kinase-like protein n=1 Tax=Isoptericola halotolerans TaxID=300560 RepID=A0ABX5EFM8_9MICO|nr:MULTISPECIES: serine/threonine-protein kinase [Isoptericola]PRZ08153.1 protein kinase-like protein [Isoptericola halotolerans]PRZ08950.1 protein kinase-like protein [Isoptericola sp. CG 20/1183]
MGEGDEAQVMTAGAPASGADGTLPAGSDIGGYSVVSLLGRGAMGAVYEAVDGGGQRVALKVLHAHVDANPAGRQRLRREVAALQRLRHPAVAQVLDAEFEGPQAFVVTELIEGLTLEEEVDARGPLDVADLFSLADQLADALESVHAAGVVHRDLKPSNVMVTGAGPSLIDFGIAQSTEDARTTMTGFVMGTPGYIAPELLDGGDPVPETDWWSWAALLAFAATGRSPFGVRPTDLVLRRSREGRADLVGVPARTGRALAGALHADPARRWGPTDVVRAVRRDLEAGASDVVGVPDDPQATQRIVVAAGAATAALAGASAAGRAGADTAVSGESADDDGTAPGAETGGDGTAPGGATREVAAARAGDETAVVGPPVPPPPPQDARRAMPADERERAMAQDGGTQILPVGDVRYRSYEELADATPDPDPEPEQPAGPYVAPVHPRRWGSVLALGLPVVVLAAFYPLIAFGVLCGLTVLCRIVGTSGQRFHERRERKGVNRSDGLVATLLFPYHAVVGALGIVPAALVGGCVGLLAVMGGYWLFGDGNLIVMPLEDVASRSVGGRNAPVVFGLVLAGAMVAVVLATWFGPAGRTARDGARTILANLAPGLLGAVIVVAVCLVGSWILYTQLSGDPHPIEWWPMGGPPSFF